ncbi:hypothetical protein BGZ68_002472 [Mortierella alpina]|nr:hypothetical protein BGZ68_002472 [Mortierella alpina]
MKPSFASAATAIEPAVQPYDRYYPTPSSLRDMSPQRSSSGGSSSRQHPRHHSSSSAASSSSSSHPQQHHQNHQHHHHHSQYSSPAYHEQQHHQHASRHHSDAQQYPHESHSHSHHSQPPQHRQHDATYASHAPTAHHAYQQYAHSYHSSAQHVKHTEGYEGRVRNTTRDHNDHLMTDPSVKDQQHHHDQFRRDPTYGYLKQHPVPSSPYAQFDEDRPAYKYNLPPILAPEEPFYRSDLPGRHMRYFSTVTSEDRENSQGYYSSARHVAPSNTTGNFGHGPPINATLEKFGSARQRQMEQQMEQQREQQMRQDEERRRQQREEEEAHHQQQHRPRLPSLYTALPEQRPGSSPAMAPAAPVSRSLSSAQAALHCTRASLDSRSSVTHSLQANGLAHVAHLISQ